MVCANPNCLEEFRSLRRGRLFVLHVVASRDGTRAQVKSKPGRLKYFWLCDSCCKSKRIAVDGENRIGIVSMEDRGGERYVQYL